MEISRRVLDGMALVYTRPEPADIERAKEIRARRDERYRNIFAQEETDQRWVGDLGEICVAAWLDAEGVPYEWLCGDDAAGKHDFTVCGWRLGVKTVKRSVNVRADYTAQVTDSHVQGEPSDGYFFLSYHMAQNTMWLLGAIGRKRFMQHATKFEGGQAVHGNYRIRENHAIWNVELGKLTHPDHWLVMARERLAA